MPHIGLKAAKVRRDIPLIPQSFQDLPHTLPALKNTPPGPSEPHLQNSGGRKKRNTTPPPNPNTTTTLPPMNPFNYSRIKSERPSWGPLTRRGRGGAEGERALRGSENKKKWAGSPAAGLQCVSELKNDSFTGPSQGQRGSTTLVMLQNQQVLHSGTCKTCKLSHLQTQGERRSKKNNFAETNSASLLPCSCFVWVFFSPLLQRLSIVCIPANQSNEPIRH